MAGLLRQQPAHFQQVAVRLDVVDVIAHGFDELTHHRLEDLKHPACAVVAHQDTASVALLGIPFAGPAHARPGGDVVEQDDRLTLPCLDAGELAQPSRVVVTTGHRDAQAQVSGAVLARLEDDLVDDVAELVDGTQTLVDAIALVGMHGDVPMQHIPEPVVAVAQTPGRLEVVVHLIHRPAVEHSQVGKVTGDVLDGDSQVGLALAVGQLLMDLAGLAVNEVGLQSLAVAHQQRVGERAVTPEEAHAMELHE